MSHTKLAHFKLKKIKQNENTNLFSINILSDSQKSKLKTFFDTTEEKKIDFFFNVRKNQVKTQTVFFVTDFPF